MKLLSFIILTAGLTLAGARAQDLTKIPPPTSPFVAPVPENADWIITAQRPPPPAPPPLAAGVTPPKPSPLPTLVHSTKTGKLKRDIVTYSDGNVTEEWYTGTVVLWKTPLGNIAVNDYSGSPTPPDPKNDNPSVPTGFPGVTWLGLENYKEVILYEKRPCYHYASDKIEAWIDAETRFPVAYKSGDTIYLFKFNEAPTEPLIPPSAYQESLKSYQKMLDHRMQLQRDLH